MSPSREKFDQKNLEGSYVEQSGSGESAPIEKPPVEPGVKETAESKDAELENIRESILESTERQNDLSDIVWAKRLSGERGEPVELEQDDSRLISETAGSLEEKLEENYQPG